MESLHQKILAAGSAVAILAGGIFYYHSSQNETIDLQNEIVYEDQTSAVEYIEPENTIVVYITGAVQNPGVIDIPEDSRVIDAVNAAGGLTSSADLEAINMADGQHVTVPEISSNENDNRIAAKKPTSTQKNSLVNINTADESELISLPGIGPATAKKIIDYRENNGAFIEIEDIKKVRGIGQSKFENMKDFITT